MAVCLPLDDPQNVFNYCPSLPASVLFAVLFGLTTVAHFFQAYHYRKSFCWVFIMGALWETLAFIIRSANIQSPANNAMYSAQLVLILLAPLWINAFGYMVLARLVHMFMPDKQLARFEGRRLGVWFVLLDIGTFIIQLAGALLTTNKNAGNHKTGLNIYTAGVALQEAVILCFISLCIMFQQRLGTNPTAPGVGKANRLMFILYFTLAMITLRIIFRIIEFSAGAGTALTNTIKGNEAFLYCLDALPMILALGAFHIYHPGKVLVGPGSEFPKRTKQEKQALKEEKKLAKAEKKKAKVDSVDMA